MSDMYRGDLPPPPPPRRLSEGRQGSSSGSAPPPPPSPHVGAQPSPAERRRSLSNAGVQLLNAAIAPNSGGDAPRPHSFTGPAFASSAAAQQVDALRLMQQNSFRDSSSDKDDDDGNAGDATDADLVFSVRSMLPVIPLHNPIDASLIVPTADKTFELKPFITMCAAPVDARAGVSPPGQAANARSLRSGRCGATTRRPRKPLAS
jgi:hypothetical protein